LQKKVDREYIPEKITAGATLIDPFHTVMLRPHHKPVGEFLMGESIVCGPDAVSEWASAGPLRGGSARGILSTLGWVFQIQ
jgi:hypothetical protein